VAQTNETEVKGSVSFFESLKQALGPKRPPAGRQGPPGPERLTQREHELFLLLLQGYTLKYCAEQMGIRYSTANTYQNAVYKKLGVKNRAALIITYKDTV